MTAIYDFYKQQVAFLTGATGGLGDCLLYKLSIVLDVQRLYKHTMPQQYQYIEDRIKAGIIVLVPGDITKERFGITIETYYKIEEEVTIIIHAAANISFRALLHKVVLDNCLPALRLAAMATKMTRLQHFVQVSSVYANFFLPDGPVEEKIYYLSNFNDAEKKLEKILRTGTTKHLQRFFWAYVYLKQLMERLIIARFPNLPILLLRFTSIGPAIAQLYQIYGPGNILDEIPWILEQPFKYFSVQYAAKVATLVFVQDKKVVQCKEAEFYQIYSRAWEFNAFSLHRLKSLNGLLRFGLNNYNIDRFAELRVKSIFNDTFRRDAYFTSKVRGIDKQALESAKL
ncbi:male sterility protein-domain-containing protein [Bisporella sp. PMI_857]|nr:male sterility protein-domain-containing protein [Bisporella sp. PMI_857]